MHSNAQAASASCAAAGGSTNAPLFILLGSLSLKSMPLKAIPDRDCHSAADTVLLCLNGMNTRVEVLALCLMV